VASLAGAIARHPRRTAQVVSEAQTLREAVPDPRVRRLRRHLGQLRRAELADVVDPNVWSELAVVAGGAALAYAETRERRAQRSRRRQTITAIAVVALAGVLAYRRAPANAKAAVPPIGR
jgi:hypothetical protein